MQKDYSYLQIKHLKPTELGFNICLAFLGFIALLMILPYTSDFSPLGLYFLGSCSALTVFLFGLVSGSAFWFEKVRKSELGHGNYSFQNSSPPQRQLNHNLVRSLLGRQSAHTAPLLIGFSETNGEGLWIETENLRQGAAIFSSDGLSHQKFLASFCMQHLLYGSNTSLVVFNPESKNKFLGKLERVLHAIGRTEDLVILGSENFTHFFNPFDAQHSTEQKAKSLILLTNLLINRATAGQSFGAETEDFFYRLVRCLDSYKNNWTVFHVAELLNNFSGSSCKLRAFFESEKNAQGLLDLSHLENFFKSASAVPETDTKQIIKLISHGFRQLADSTWGKILGGSGISINLKNALESGRIIYVAGDESAQSVVSNAVSDLILEELKSISKDYAKYSHQTAYPAMIAVLADPMTKISNFGAISALAKSPCFSLLFSGGNWKDKFKFEDAEFVRKRLLAISSVSFFKFLLGFDYNDNFASILENLSEINISGEATTEDSENAGASPLESASLSCQLISPDTEIPIFSPLLVNFESSAVQDAE